MELLDKLQLHYYFDDSSHSMDAFVRNKCEAELLSAVQELSKILGASIAIDAELSQEGGIKDLWKLAGDNNNQLTLILIVITLFFSRVPLQDAEHEAMKKEETKLSIDEKKLNILKLKSELQNSDFGIDHVEDVTSIASNNLKMLTRRSNFYKNLDPYKKVTTLGFSNFNQQDEEYQEEKKVTKNNFHKFILKTNLLPVTQDDKAIIEIISPVLKNGKYKWKGIYEEEVISFDMKDTDFKNQVLSEGMQFQSGTTIECVLEIYRKLDNVGEVVITGYGVKTVIYKHDDYESIETPQGRSYKFTKKQEEGQADLFH